MPYYRIMVEGEDGMLFCYQNDVLGLDAVEDKINEAEESYPCGRVWAELEEK